MKFELFINFNGNCREATEFYAKVFKSEVKNACTYGEAPPDPNFPIAEENKDRICYSEVLIGGLTVMFSDFPSGSSFVAGNNISPTVSIESKVEVERVFNELKEGGQVFMELQQTFFSELFGMVKDKYGVIWQILYYSREEGNKE
jgi:PhnB protein